MVLPSSSAQSPLDWIDRVESLLELGGRKVLILLRGAGPEHVRPLARSLSPSSRQGRVEVALHAGHLKSAPPDSTVILCLRRDDLEFLNLTRGVLGRLRLRVIILASPALIVELGSRAPDLFDWISHVIEAPAHAPGYLTETLELLSPLTGLSDPSDSALKLVKAVSPDGSVRVLSASMGFRELRETLSRPGWLVVPDTVDSISLQLAMAVSGRRGELLAQGRVPGWPRLPTPLRDFESLDAWLLDAGLEAGHVAACLDFDPEALELVRRLGLDLGPFARDLRVEADSSLLLAERSFAKGLVSRTEAAIGRGPALCLRAAASDEERRRAWTDDTTAKLERGEEVDHDDFLVWARLSSTPVSLERLRGQLDPLLGLCPLLRHAQNPLAWVEASSMALERGRIEVALDLANRAAERAPEDWRPAAALGRARAEAGDLEGASAALETALQLAGPGRNEDRAVLIAELSGVFVEQARFDAAAGLLDAALSGREHISDKGRAELLDQYANLEAARGRYSVAEAHARAALDAGLSAGEGCSPADIIALRANLSRVISKRGRSAEALDVLREAMQTAEEHFEPEHPHLMALHHNLARRLLDAGKVAEAEARLREVLETEERTLPKAHPSLARTRLTLAETLMAQDRLTEALEHARMAERSAARTLGPDHPFVGSARLTLGLLEAGLVPQAELDAKRSDHVERILEMVESALERRREVLGPRHPELASDLRRKGWALAQLERYGDALEALDEAEQVWTSLPEISELEWRRLEDIRAKVRSIAHPKL